MDFTLKGKMVFFATGNIHKFNEARIILAQYGLAGGMLREKALEIQSDNLLEIAIASAEDAYSRCHLPLIVEDAGLFVEALKGFPGPYAAYVYKTLDNKGLLKQMQGVRDRKAIFHSVIAYSDGGRTECFEGEVSGEITTKEKKINSKSAFGFDPIFQPEGSDRTFAQMTLEGKNAYSHRAKSIRKFVEWYKTLT